MRRMLRRAALAAVFLTLLTVASASAATTKTVSIYATKYSPTPVQIAMGDSVKWTNTTRKSHTVASDAAMLSSWFFPNKTMARHKTSTPVTFPEAGTFLYHDTNNAALRGQVSVPMKTDTTVVTLGGSTVIVLGTVGVAAPMVHVVQARLNGGAWSIVYSSNGNSFTFKPSSAGTWELQTYIHHALSGWNTGTSPILTVTAY